MQWGRRQRPRVGRAVCGRTTERGTWCRVQRAEQGGAAPSHCRGAGRAACGAQRTAGPGALQGRAGHAT